MSAPHKFVVLKSSARKATTQTARERSVKEIRHGVFPDVPVFVKPVNYNGQVQGAQGR